MLALAENNEAEEKVGEHDAGLDTEDQRASLLRATDKPTLDGGATRTRYYIPLKLFTRISLWFVSGNPFCSPYPWR